jgi:hypothetical protein
LGASIRVKNSGLAPFGGLRPLLWSVPLIKQLAQPLKRRETNSAPHAAVPVFATPGYTGKLLGAAQINQFGVTALLAISATLGLCFDVRIDPEQEALMRPHWEPGQHMQRRTCRQARIGKVTMARAFPVVAKEIAKRGGEARRDKLSPARRRAIAREAGRASGRARLRRGLMEAASPERD